MTFLVRQLQKEPELFKHYQIGISLFKRNQYLEALDRFKRVISKKPDSLPDILIPLYKRILIQFTNPQLRLMVAELYIFSEQYESAYDELLDAIDVNNAIGQSYFLLHKLYFKSPAHQKRIQTLFEEAFSNKIFDQSILDLLPKLYIDAKDYEKSLRFYETLIQENPGYAHNYKDMVNSYIQLRKYDEAAKLIRFKVTQNPDVLEEAIGLCQSILKYVPTSVPVLTILIGLHIQSCNPMAALTQIQGFFKLAPNQKELVQQLMNQILEAFPSNKQVLLALAELLIETQAYSEAIEHLRTVFLKFNCDYDHLIHLVQRILDTYPNQLYAMQLLFDIQLKRNMPEMSLEVANQMLKFATEDGGFLSTKLPDLIHLYPHHIATAHHLLMQYHMKNKAYSEAAPFIQHLYGTAFEEQAYLTHAEWHKEKQDYRSAQETLIEGRKKYSENNAFHFALLDLYRKLQKTMSPHICIQICHVPEAKENKLKQITSDKTEATLFALWSLGQFEEAEIVLRATPIAEATDIQWFYLGINTILKGTPSQALKYFSKLEPNSKYAPYTEKEQRLLNRHSASNWDYILPIQNPFNKYTHAMGLLVPPPAPLNEPLVSLGQSHNVSGILATSKRDFESAKKLFQAALQIDPAAFAPVFNLATIGILSGDLTAAKNHVQKLDIQLPHFAGLDLLKGIIALKENDTTKAASYFEEAHIKTPENPLSKLYLGDITIEKNPIKALTYWESLKPYGHLAFHLKQRLAYLYADSFTSGYWTDIVPATPSTPL